MLCPQWRFYKYGYIQQSVLRTASQNETYVDSGMIACSENAVIGKMSWYLIQHFLHFTNGLTEPKINKLPRCLGRGGGVESGCLHWGVVDLRHTHSISAEISFSFCIFLFVRSQKKKKTAKSYYYIYHARPSVCSYEATRPAGDGVLETGDFY